MLEHGADHVVYGVGAFQTRTTIQINFTQNKYLKSQHFYNILIIRPSSLHLVII